MIEQFLHYYNNLNQEVPVPVSVYEGLLSIFVVGLVLLVAFKGVKNGLRFSSGLLLLELIFLLLCFTVIFRTPSMAARYDFHPFWSYVAIQEGREELLPENVMNVIGFLPVGLLLGVCMRGKKEDLNWKSGWLIAFMVGLCISVSIEALQYFTHRGFSEFDDVFHNTLGCVIGYGIFKSGSWLMVHGSGLMVKDSSCGSKKDSSAKI